VTRDNYLLSQGITTVRIDTIELENGNYKEKVKLILEHLSRFYKELDFYKSTIKKIEDKTYTDEDIVQKMLPTSIIRFQILLLELLENQYLNFAEDWKFNVIFPNQLELEIFENTTYREEFYRLVQICGKNSLELAITDLQIWIDKLWQLKNKNELKMPNVKIEITCDKAKFQPTSKAVNIDFSLFKRYTDEDKLNTDVIYLRTDYFDYNSERKLKGLDKNYFRVSIA